MYYVYVLQSLGVPERFYTGITGDLRGRLAAHNAGESVHTNKFRPWGLRTYVAFDDLGRAEAFEIYLKTGSGRVFARRRL